MRVDLPRGIQVRPQVRPDGGVTVEARIPLGRELIRLGVDLDPDSIKRARSVIGKYAKLRDDAGNDVAGGAWVKAVLGTSLTASGMGGASVMDAAPTPELVQAVREVAQGAPSGHLPARAYQLAMDALSLYHAASMRDPGALAELASIDAQAKRGILSAVERSMAQVALASINGSPFGEVLGMTQWEGVYPPDAQDAIGSISRARRGLNPYAVQQAEHAMRSLWR